MIRTTDKSEFHIKNPKIRSAILSRKDPVNLLSQCQYAILIDTVRNNTIVKLTMKCSTDALVLTNGNLLIETTFFS